MISLQNVSLSYGTGPQILCDISLTMKRGDFHFLIGASGAGKSSLLRCLYLAQRPTSGQIKMFERDVFALSRQEQALLRRDIGIIFQDFRLLPHLNALENVLLPLSILGESTKGSLLKAKELLAWVGLENEQQQYPQTLSGGQQQRVAIARAVVTRPQLILADEPTGNLDDTIAYRLMHLFSELHRMGTTVVIATHNEHLAARYAHPKLVLTEGKILAQDKIFADTQKIEALP